MIVRAAASLLALLLLCPAPVGAQTARGGPIESSGPVQKKKPRSTAPRKSPAPRKTRPAVKPRPRRKPVRAKKKLHKRPSKRRSRRSSKKRPVRAATRKGPESSVRDRDLHMAAGASLEPSRPGLRVLRVFQDSPLAEAGLKPNDTLLYLNGRRMTSLADATRAVGSWKPGTRLSAVANRARSIEPEIRSSDLRGRMVSLRTPFVRALIPGPRTAAALTLSEGRLRDLHLVQAKKFAAKAPSALRARGFRIKKGERIWIRFPQGIPVTVGAGDVIEGETTTSMATSSKLDFIAIPQGSRVWAQVLSVRSKGPVVRLVKLHIYKIQLEGGHSYDCSGLLSNVSGDRTRLRVSAGGTIVAAPRDDEQLLVHQDQSLQITFRKGWTIHEPASFYRAGPGLWVRTVGKDKGRAFEITHVIPGRSAQQAGLKKGDRIYYIGSASAGRMDFSEAIRRLYGKPGTEVQVRVKKTARGRARRISLLRGVVYRRGLGLNLSRREGVAVITRIEAGSPADQAALKVGNHILEIDGQPVKPMKSAALKQLLRSKKAVKLSYGTPGRSPHALSLKPGPFPVPLNPTALLKTYDILPQGR